MIKNKKLRISLESCTECPYCQVDQTVDVFFCGHDNSPDANWIASAYHHTNIRPFQGKLVIPDWCPLLENKI
jgi:hypothetical protein